MKIWTSLKSRNRTLLEMHMGILFFGICCQVVGAFIAEDQWYFAKSLWFGIIFALVASVHMYRTLDRALWYGEEAQKLVARGYMFRYAAAIVIFAVIGVTGVMNVLVVFLGYMSLKVTAYLQPITHKLCNKIFHETDPEPEPLVEEEVSQAESTPQQNNNVQG